MYVVTGASGQTGSHVVKKLLERDRPVRALVRREEQAASWRQAGAEAIVLDLADQPVLAEAFSGASGVYLMNPPAYGVKRRSKGTPDRRRRGTPFLDMMLVC